MKKDENPLSTILCSWTSKCTHKGTYRKLFQRPLISIITAHHRVKVSDINHSKLSENTPLQSESCIRWIIRDFIKGIIYFIETDKGWSNSSIWWAILNFLRRYIRGYRARRLENLFLLELLRCTHAEREANINATQDIYGISLTESERKCYSLSHYRWNIHIWHTTLTLREPWPITLALPRNNYQNAESD